MNKRLTLVFAVLLFAVGSASADSVTYQVTVDTSSISGTAGSLDFQFNPGGLDSQGANLQILVFNSDGTLTGSPTLTGDASGALPGTVTFDNATAFNDYFQDFTYGNTITFDVSLFGPALTAPDGTSTSGSTFAFSMFSDGAGTVPTLTTDTTDGFAFTIDVNLDGTTTLSNFSDQVTATPLAAVPEPGSLSLLISGLLGFAALAFVRRKQEAV